MLYQCPSQAVKRTRHDGLVDWISELPDEILVNIISLLNFSEALSTSVLSSRWIHLWKSAVSVLDFDGSNLFDIQKPVLWPLEPFDMDQFIFLDYDPINPPKESPIVVAKRLMYRNSVNRVLREINVFQIKKFRVSFNLTGKNNSEGDIDRWIEFAISKRVEFLELSFGAMRDGFDFPYKADYNLSGGCYSYIRTPTGLSNIKHLRSLRLSYVDVEEGTIEYIIFNCPLLEELAVDNAKSAQNLRVAGSPSSPLALKYLELRDFFELMSVESGSLVDVDISLTDCYYEWPSLAFERLADCVGQLESLSLYIAHYNPDASDDNDEEIEAVEKKVCRDSIKVVEIINFNGYDVDYEFVEYVIEYFTGLERIVIEREVWKSKCYELRAEAMKIYQDKLEEVKNCALELKSFASPGVEFIIV
ncbi:Putative F-box/LRR-repeat protein At5g02700 [Linum perenne]